MPSSATLISTPADARRAATDIRTLSPEYFSELSITVEMTFVRWNLSAVARSSSSHSTEISARLPPLTAHPAAMSSSTGRSAKRSLRSRGACSTSEADSICSTIEASCASCTLTISM